MATMPARVPPQVARLPEPARTKAIEVFRALVRDGSPEDDAIERAVAMANQWVFERAPGDRSHVPAEGDAAPERPAGPSGEREREER